MFKTKKELVERPRTYFGEVTGLNLRNGICSHMWVSKLGNLQVLSPLVPHKR